MVTKTFAKEIMTIVHKCFREFFEKPTDNVVGAGPVRPQDPFNLVLGNEIAQNIPLLDPILNIILTDRPEIVGFHILSFPKISSLIEIQNTDKAISITTNMTPCLLKSFGTKGMLTPGGFVAKIRGSVLLAGDHDLYSLVDLNGNRWLRTTALVDYVSDSIKDKVILSKIRKRIMLFGKVMIYKWIEKFDATKMDLAQAFTINQKQLAQILKDLLEMFPAPRQDEIRKEIIQEYVFGIAKIFEEYKEYLSRAFYDLSGILHINDSYNEVVVNNIKILGMLAMPLERKKGEYSPEQLTSMNLNQYFPVTIVSSENNEEQTISSFLSGN